MVNSVINIITWLLCFFTASALGYRGLDLLKISFEDPTEKHIIASALGLGVLAYLVLILGLFGFLFFPCAVIMLIICAVLLRRDFARALSRAWLIIKKIIFPTGPVSEKCMVLCIFIVMLSALIGALAPAVGHDALSYHLEIPKRFIQNHNVSFINYTRESLWPFLIQMLFTLGLLLRGPVTAKLFHYGFFILGIGAVFTFARRFLPRKHAVFAALIFSLTPGMFMQAAYAYVDIALTVYVFLAFYALWISVRQNSVKWLILSGIFAGFCLSIKLLALGYVAVLGILLIFSAFQDKKPLRVFIFSAVVIAVSGFWYARSWILLGNPVFPFFSAVFKGHGWPTDIASSVGMGKSIILFILMPWNLVMYPGAFGGEQIGIIFLAFLPYIIIYARRTLLSGWMWFFVILFSVFWFVTAQNLRFFLPAVPFLCVLFAGTPIIEDQGQYAVKGFSGFLKTACCVMLMMNLGLCIYHSYDKIAVVSGFESPRQYMSEKQCTYNIFDYINRTLPEHAKILVVGEPRVFYSERDTIGFALLKKMTKDFPGHNPVDYIKKIGVTHILVYKDRDIIADDFKVFSNSKDITQIHYEEYKNKTARVGYILYEIH